MIRHCDEPKSDIRDLLPERRSSGNTKGEHVGYSRWALGLYMVFPALQRVVDTES